MGMTQLQLAERVSVDAQTVGRWERESHPIDPTAETVIRRLAGEKLIEAFNQSIEELVGHIQSAKLKDEINIQAEGEQYRLLAA